MPTYNGAWLKIWEVLFVVTVAIFAAVTVVVAIRGGAELRRLFSRDRRANKP